MACARAKLETLGYQQTSFDQTDFRLTARKIDNSVHRADPQYRHNIDRVEVQAAPGADGKTSLAVTGRTYAEFSTQRGPTEEEEQASKAVGRPRRPSSTPAGVDPELPAPVQAHRYATGRRGRLVASPSGAD